MIFCLIIMRTNSAGQEFPIRSVGPFGTEDQARAHWILNSEPDVSVQVVPHTLPATPASRVL